ncbi:MAG: amidohydrolase family protein [Candidatus Neomarinimicrobiota bacterium]|jgi:allantoinase|nr:amidohydrolase family protein [Candidatus Neomarinimicrobiota bacterium]MDX9779994.1 amidohydrolase family protein [bacterium]
MIIKNANIALPGRNDFVPLDIEIQEGKILRTGADLSGDEILDAAGLQVFPGAVDSHVHFNEPGYTEREDFYHGSAAAASGGVTTLIDMPCTSLPPLIDKKALDSKLDIVKKHALIDFGFFGGVSAKSFFGDWKNNMKDMAADVMGFKTYFLSGMESFPQLSPLQFEQVLRVAQSLGRPVLLHAEDPALVEKFTKREQAKGDSWLHYYRSRPEKAEFRAVKKAIKAARRNSADLHIVHVGTGKAAKILRRYAHVSGETAPHYLAFDIRDLERIGAALKTNPVVKKPANKNILWRCLQNGTLDFVASDHAPAPDEMKNTGSVWTDYAGIPGSGTMFPFLYSEALIRRKMPLTRFLQITAENAAKRYGFFDRKGSIEIGKDADLVLVDPKAVLQIRGADFLSKGKITPFEGQVFQGKVIKTIVRGKTVYDADKGVVTDPGYGCFIRPAERS